MLEWNPSTGKQRTVVRKAGGSASIEHDLLSIYTKDPYDGGCTRLVRLSKPRVKVWKSCRERIAAISPDGTQLLTFHILTDGLGPGEIHLRELDGTKLATWTTNWFSGWQWESPGRRAARGQRQADVRHRALHGRAVRERDGPGEGAGAVVVRCRAR